MDVSQIQPFLRPLLPVMAVAGLESQSRSACLQANPLVEIGDQLAGLDFGAPCDLKHDLAQRLKSRSESATKKSPARNDARQVPSRMLEIRFVDDTFTLPPMKRMTAESSQASSQTSSTLTPQTPVYPDGCLHSPLSPLNPRSVVYPDKLMHEFWLQKYQYLFPGMFVSFHTILISESAEDVTASDHVLLENINRLKQQFDTRGIRYVAVLVSPKSLAEDPSLEARLLELRKLTQLPARMGLLWATPGSEIELETLTESICLLAYSQASDLQSLPYALRAREARYSMKLSILSELRQDLEVAIKTYEQTYDLLVDLLGTSPTPDVEEQDIKADDHRDASNEQSAHISPAFTPIELLEVVAYKMIQLTYIQGLPQVAYQIYQAHAQTLRIKLSSQLHGKKKGYWRARLNYLTAELMDESSTSPERSIELFKSAGVPLSGYLYLQVAEDLKNDPLAVSALQKAIHGFQSHGSIRSEIYAKFLLAKELNLQKDDSSHTLKLYTEVARACSRDKWNVAHDEVLASLSDFKFEESQQAVKLAIELGAELLENSEETIRVSPIFDSHFTCRESQGHIGVPVTAQLTLWLPCTKALRLKVHKIEVFFDGPLSDLTIEHDDSYETLEVASKMNNNEEEVYRANLSETSIGNKTMHAVTLSLLPRARGVSRIKRISAHFQPDHHVNMISDATLTPLLGEISEWYTRTENGIVVSHIRSSEPSQISITFRKSRLTIDSERYMSAVQGECMLIPVSVRNGEPEGIKILLKSNVYAIEGNGNIQRESVAFSWESEAGNIMNNTISFDSVASHEFLPATWIRVQVPISASSLEIQTLADYRNLSDIESEVADSWTIKIQASPLFLIDYTLEPRFHPEEWPSFFEPSDVQRKQSLKRRWSFQGALSNNFETPLRVLSYNVQFMAEDDVVCSVISSSEIAEMTMTPGHKFTVDNLFDMYREGSSEKRMTTLKVNMEFKWTRDLQENNDGALTNEYKIPLVRLNLPMQEPRVIIDLQSKEEGDLIDLIYYIENPSGHVLHFQVLLTDTDEFLTQGPQQALVCSLPYTRKALRYCLKPLGNSSRRPIPTVKVYDVNYKRTLVNTPAHPQLSIDNGVLIYTPPAQDS